MNNPRLSRGLIQMVGSLSVRRGWYWSAIRGLLIGLLMIRYSHPLLLVRRAAAWLFLDEAKFRDCLLRRLRD